MCYYTTGEEDIASLNVLSFFFSSFRLISDSNVATAEYSHAETLFQIRIDNVPLVQCSDPIFSHCLTEKNKTIDQ